MSDFATPEEMQAAINSSGYLLEGRVARMMTEAGYFVQPNCFILDPNDSDKSIEIDVVGNHAVLINEENHDTVIASLFVECKNNSQPFAFFVQRPQLVVLNVNRILHGGFPTFSMDPETKVQVPLSQLLSFSDWHHYCKTQEVATQFCSFKWTNENRPKDGRIFKAEPMENYSKSFSSLAEVAASDSSSPVGLKLKNIQIQLSYPVVVFQGPIYRVEDMEGKARVEQVDRLQLHHSALIGGEVKQVQIDLVTESAFPSLLAEIDGELKEARERCEPLYPRLLHSALEQKAIASRRATKHLFVPPSMRW